MATTAIMAARAGHFVRGSDAGVYPPMSNVLSDAGIEYFNGYDAKHFEEEYDIIVTGNAMTRGNPEVEFLLNTGREMTSLPRFLSDFFLRGNTPLVITGTHGKTTTTAITAHLLLAHSPETGYMIAGKAKNFPEPGKTADNSWFVIEGDEYDSAFFDKRSKFIHYRPRQVVINNLEFDHADIFRDLEDIKRSFRHLIRIIPSEGFLLVNGDDENVKDIVSQIFTNIYTFGLSEENTFRATEITETPEGTEFVFLRDGEKIAHVQSPLSGTHNVRNVLAALAITILNNLNIEKSLLALSSFSGVARRMEMIVDNPELTIIDDFAHHPTAMREVLQSLKNRYPQRRIIAIVEPRSNTLVRNFFQEELADALGLADTIVLGHIHRLETIEESKRLNIEKVIQRLDSYGKKAVHISDPEAIQIFLEKEKLDKDVWIMMSNGAFGGLSEKLRVQYGEQ